MMVVQLQMEYTQRIVILSQMTKSIRMDGMQVVRAVTLSQNRK